jgi:hypothetical protein
LAPTSRWQPSLADSRGCPLPMSSNGDTSSGPGSSRKWSWRRLSKSSAAATSSIGPSSRKHPTFSRLLRGRSILPTSLWNLPDCRHRTPGPKTAKTLSFAASPRLYSAQPPRKGRSGNSKDIKPRTAAPGRRALFTRLSGPAGSSPRIRATRSTQCLASSTNIRRASPD